MSRAERISAQLKEHFRPHHLDLVNESDLHSGPPGRETHFKLFLVSSAFEGKSRLERQRMVNSLLAEEFRQGLHALSQRLLTPSEWLAQGKQINFDSLPCLGGGEKKS
ncbi:MAG: BolA family transcriptional regulator [Bdellovibrionaceae bacterium]|nr:BolA family transcriptional regulator [Pseudobdellovibrionaceae bacterium]